MVGATTGTADHLAQPWSLDSRARRSGRLERARLRRTARAATSLRLLAAEGAFGYLGASRRAGRRNNFEPEDVRGNRMCRNMIEELLDLRAVAPGWEL